ncbi:L-serine ammonia-lyase [Acinetobacter faecalis]|uniref:L-serine ammonia-lyase n=1 Tax=Acinetobacter faecalis TaxID=2665161 RepID=UPI002A91F6A9|nr:L-serine ammonia-lyase [Acinetobacter faecalis]MDY6451288.1 L-serine ammonia-lyase [Acinetobacter faecalis]
MTLSVFDLFKIGIGPSSSHTVGPMRAACQFIENIQQQHVIKNIARIQITLYGSLSATGVGHATDQAVLLGLMGFHPETIDTNNNAKYLSEIEQQVLNLNLEHKIKFCSETDLIFSSESLPYHPNAMTIEAFESNGQIIYENTYYSVGGGFILEHQETSHPVSTQASIDVPFPFQNTAELLAHCEAQNSSISQIMLENEKTWLNENQIREKILSIWAVMKECIENGLSNEGILPGGLFVKRRAKKLHEMLQNHTRKELIFSSFQAMEWVNLYALAVNEENAAGGRVVTAPTNGASGIIPAVLYYYLHNDPSINEDSIVEFFLAAAAIGILCKLNASISGAEVGCQGEVGSACAMASAGLAEMFGGSPQQVENAAEIGLEHNLGLTCDPIGGLVQIPCIERNAIAAVKAINAAQMALRGDGEHHVSLDKVIQTMKETGKDMSEKYKETSKGGLAVNAIEC